MEGNYYDDVSIAASYKREQLMNEAEEHRLIQHIAAIQKLDKSQKKLSVENHRKYWVLHPVRPNSTT